MKEILILKQPKNNLNTPVTSKQKLFIDDVNETETEESLNNKQVIGLFYSRGTRSVCFNSSSGQEGTTIFKKKILTEQKVSMTHCVHKAEIVDC